MKVKINFMIKHRIKLGNYTRRHHIRVNFHCQNIIIIFLLSGKVSFLENLFVFPWIAEVYFVLCRVDFCGVYSIYEFIKSFQSEILFIYKKRLKSIEEYWDRLQIYKSKSKISILCYLSGLSSSEIKDKNGK